MEPECSLPHSQVPASSPYPELGRTKVSVQVRGFQCEQDTFLSWGIVSTSPNPQPGGPRYVGCPLLLIQYIRSYPPYWRAGIA